MSKLIDPKAENIPRVFEGVCPICERDTVFRADNAWFRDSLKCDGCGSIPRERALMRAITIFYPQWRSLAIHESSPVFRGVSKKLRDECVGYLFTQYIETIERGAVHPEQGWRNEDLENQTFEASIFDIVITQDVFEHLFDPVAATNEIMRTLRTGGAHIFTVPIVRKNEPSRRRAWKVDGTIINVLPAEYHGNPVSNKGALVTIDWGYDILRILSAAGHPHTMLYIDDISQGIRAEYIEVLVGHRGPIRDSLGDHRGTVAAGETAPRPLPLLTHRQ